MDGRWPWIWHDGHVTPERPQEPASARRPRRVLWGVLLAASLAIVGLAAGTALGARFFVPEGSGLAGPAIALDYGLIGVLFALIAAGFLAWKAPPAILRRATIAALLLAAVTIGLVALRAVRQSTSPDRPAAGGKPAPAQPQ